MKFLVLLAIVGVAAAQRGGVIRTSTGGEIQVLRHEYSNAGDGTYDFIMETSDGTLITQKGYLKPAPSSSDEPIQVQEGSFQFISPEGETYKVEFLADENGFQPRGEHLPTSPPIPPEILRSLEIIFKNAGDQRGAASYQQTQQTASFRPASRPGNRRY